MEDDLRNSLSSSRDSLSNNMETSLTTDRAICVHDEEQETGCSEDRPLQMQGHLNRREIDSLRLKGRGISQQKQAGSGCGSQIND